MLINVKGDSDQLNGVLADYLYKVGRRCKSQAFCGFVLWFRCPVTRVLLSSMGNRKYSRLKKRPTKGQGHWRVWVFMHMPRILFAPKTTYPKNPRTKSTSLIDTY